MNKDQRPDSQFGRLIDALINAAQALTRRLPKVEMATYAVSSYGESPPKVSA